MRRNNDMLWKGLIEEMFDDLLRFMFPGIDEEVDFTKGIIFLDKEFGAIDPKPGRRAPTRKVDKLIQVYLHSGWKEKLLFHVEFQGERDQNFSRRMFQYFYRIYDKHPSNVSSIAIFTGKQGDKMPNQFEYDCHGTNFVFRHNRICLSALSEEDLVQSKNPFALVLLVAKPLVPKPGEDPENALLEKKVQLSFLAHRKGYCNKFQLRAILTFLENYILFKDPNKENEYRDRTKHLNKKSNHMGIIEQVAEMKANQIVTKAKRLARREGRQQGRQKGREEGLQEGRQEGRQEAKTHLVKALFAQTDLPYTKISEIVGLPVQQVEQIKRAITMTA
jgi:hypothetical protein